MADRKQTDTSSSRIGSPDGSALPENTWDFQRGNVFMERLPPVETDLEVALRLGFAPARPPIELLNAPQHVRLDYLALQPEIHVALSHELDAYRDLHGIVRRAYLHRNPTDPRVQKHIYAVSALTEADWRTGRGLQLLTRLCPSGGGALGYTIVAPTGMGKSSFRDRLVAAFGGVEPEVFHEIGGRKCRLTQLKILPVSCTGEGLKDVCSNMLMQVDAALGTDYSRVGRRTVALWEYVSMVTRSLTSNFLGLLVIDDLQRLADSDAQIKKTLQLFANLMQTTGIPILSLGTYRVTQVLSSPNHMQEGSKLMVLGKTTFECLRCGVEWKRLNEALWSYRASHLEVEMPDFLPAQTHWYSQGIPRYLKILMTSLFKWMVRNEKSVVDAKAVDEAAQDSLTQYAAPLRVMRERAVGVKVSAETADVYENFLTMEAPSEKQMPSGYPDVTKALVPSDGTLGGTNESANVEARLSDSAKGNSQRKPSKKAGKGKRKVDDVSKVAEAISCAAVPLEKARRVGLSSEFKL